MVVNILDTNCSCSADYDPYCCKGDTYSNECAAICDGMDIDADCRQLECAEDCYYAFYWDPYCCDGDTYSNSDAAECYGWDVDLHEECKYMGDDSDAKCTLSPTTSPTPISPTSNPTSAESTTAESTATDYFMTTSDGSCKYLLIALCIAFMMGLY